MMNQCHLSMVHCACTVATQGYHWGYASLSNMCHYYVVFCDTWFCFTHCCLVRLSSVLFATAVHLSLLHLHCLCSGNQDPSYMYIKSERGKGARIPLSLCSFSTWNVTKNTSLSRIVIVLTVSKDGIGSKWPPVHNVYEELHKNRAEEAKKLTDYIPLLFYC